MSVSTKPQNNISDKRRLLEIIAVFLTGAGKFILMDWLEWKFPFIVLSIVGWGGYVWIRYRSDQSILKYWGFRTDNFREAFRLVLPFGLLAVVSFFAVGYWQDTLNINWHLIPILITYPIWGVIQQFLVIALVAGNFQDMKSMDWSKMITIVITATLFGAIHYPFYWLIAGTFVLALFYGFVYLRVKNIWLLGLFHGWLGGLFFYTVVNRDPFMEVFGRYLE